MFLKKPALSRFFYVAGKGWRLEAGGWRLEAGQRSALKKKTKAFPGANACDADCSGF
jgi:hypothetical protein